MCGHKNLVLDVAWNPFDENQIASASEDCTVKLWTIPDEGLKENLTGCDVDLSGHQKKVVLIFYPLFSAFTLLHVPSSPSLSPSPPPAG